MLTNLTNKKKKNVKLNKRGLPMRKLYRPYLPREAAARGLLEVSLCRWLRKTRTDSSSSPSEGGCREQQLKASCHNRYY